MKLLALFGLAACTLITSGCCNVCPEAAQAKNTEFFGMARSTTSTPRHRFVEKYNGWHKRYDAKRNQLYVRLYSSRHGLLHLHKRSEKPCKD